MTQDLAVIVPRHLAAEISRILLGLADSSQAIRDEEAWPAEVRAISGRRYVLLTLLAERITTALDPPNGEPWAPRFVT